jgi:hypothetical protein
MNAPTANPRCGDCVRFEPIPLRTPGEATHGICAFVHDNAPHRLSPCRFSPSQFLQKEPA